MTSSAATLPTAKPTARTIATPGRPSDRLDPDTRINRLEQICNELWTIEPDIAPQERTRLLRQLGDVERKIASLTLTLIVDPDAETQIDDQLCRCERRVDQLRSIWEGTSGR